MGMSYVPGLARGCHIGSSPACYVVVGLNYVLGLGKPILVCPLFWMDAFFNGITLRSSVHNLGWRFPHTTIYKRNMPPTSKDGLKL